MVCGKPFVEALSTVGRAKKYPQSTKRRDCGRVKESNYTMKAAIIPPMICFCMKK